MRCWKSLKFVKIKYCHFEMLFKSESRGKLPEGRNSKYILWLRYGRRYKHISRNNLWKQVNQLFLLLFYRKKEKRWKINIENKPKTNMNKNQFDDLSNSPIAALQIYFINPTHLFRNIEYIAIINQSHRYVCMLLIDQLPSRGLELAPPHAGRPIVLST